MEKKEFYVTPILEIITLTEDIIVTSNDQETDSDGGELWGA